MRLQQSAEAFNQPLSFDTSSVTGMNRMFEVRFCNSWTNIGRRFNYLHLIDTL